MHTKGKCIKDLFVAIGTRNWETVEQETRKYQKLIESAPDLLEACKEAVKEVEYQSKIYYQCLEAVSQAGGGIMKKQHINIRISEEDKEVIREQAHREGRTISGYILWVLSQYKK